VAATPNPSYLTGTLAGRRVHRIGYGVMQLEIGKTNPEIRNHAPALLRRAVELGINHFDTAEFYGDGTLNRVIGETLHPDRDQLVIVTKIGAEHHPEKRIVASQRPEQLRRQVEANLKSLRLEQVPVVNLRRADAAPGTVATGDQVVDLDDQLAELIGLRAQGKIGAIGLSNVSLEQLEQALPADIACVQNMYNLLERDGEPLLELCLANGVAWVPYFPLGSAFPGWPKVVDQPEVISIAQRIDAAPAQVALAWLLAHAPNILLIPGTTDPAHLAENVAIEDLRLDEQTVAELERVTEG
jgi:pyridoxine 4-dehydrogenase